MDWIIGTIKFLATNWGIFGWAILIIVGIPILALIAVIITAIVKLFFTSFDVVVKFIISLAIFGLFLLMFGMAFDIPWITNLLSGGGI